MLADGERATGAQVVVAIFPSLEGESLEDFSIRLAEKWRVGRKALDDGAIVVVFVADRKVRIEVGYGLEARSRTSRPDASSASRSRRASARAGTTPGSKRRPGRSTRASRRRRRPSGGDTSRGRGSTFPFWGVVGFFGSSPVIAVMLMREAATTRG